MNRPMTRRERQTHAALDIGGGALILALIILGLAMLQSILAR